ncbi:MAG: hybrid sensor histidine kinase/response regulator [Actinobacteria bacterium]|nr:hybrid sensor histidine kinase/response regulator [Actinomycetota bacterium]
MVEFDRSAFISKFQEEAQELLQRLNEGVISLEASPDDAALLDQMLRDAHTLKGSSRMVGLLEISDVAHRLEDIMVKIREKEIAYTPKLSDSFFEALDAIVYLADNGGKNIDDMLDLADLQVRLTKVAEDEPTQPKKKAPAKRGKKSPDRPVEDPPEVLPEGSGAPSKRDDKLQAKAHNTIRVKTSQVDRLLNLISEIVISQIKEEQRIVELRQGNNELNELWQSWVKIKSQLTSLEIENEAMVALLEECNRMDSLLAERRRSDGIFLKSFAEDVARASVVVSELQEQGMRVRMLPVSTIFQTFPRAMRDLAKSFKKDVELIIEGEDTELDKKVLEEINDPLIHIMRNAVDHGIEPLEVREALGKPPKGTIRMTAHQEGDRIVIEVADDGAGVDPARVKAAAVRKGYLSQNEADAMSDREAIYLIFERGFSTSSIITEISGRGVGMDVVREFIVEKLKGSLDVNSKLGEGSVFRLTIPLTLAIIRALIMKVGDQVFALPTTSIEETLRVTPSEIIKVEGRDVIRRQRRTIPLVRLGDVLGVPHKGPKGLKTPIATIGFAGHRIGLVVDALIGEQQIVIKPLGSHLRKVDNVAGVTVLGAGDVVPILNVPDLMDRARRRSGAKVVSAEESKRQGPKRVLICEDSFTTRELERSIFEAAGYEVEVALDGAMGLAKLKEGLAVDAVVTDVQMPNMTGFELTRAIKADPALARIPVIIVTSLERDEEKAEGAEAGADAYITKSVFNQDTLLDTVDRLIR